MKVRTYSSPMAFKQALEQRLRSVTKTGAEFARKRQLLVFDRFLARIVATLGEAATLKGGLVLELRLDRARTTKDVDLRLMETPSIHNTAQSPQFTGERPSGHRLAGNRPKPRRKFASQRHRSDFQAQGDPPCAQIRSRPA